MDALYAVPAGGGAVKPVTEVADSMQGQLSHRTPHFLPGSREFTYLTQDGAGRVNESYFASLDAPQATKPLLSELSEVAAPPGYLLFVREATLIAQPFDAKRLELTGSAFPLAKGISNSYPRTGFASFSVSDTGVLAYRSLERPSTELVWYDRRGERMETIAPADQYFDVDLSPDGHGLTFLRGQSTNSTRELWVRELDRGTSSRLASGSLSSPRWSPDGRSLFYVGEPSVYRQRVDRADSREPVLAPEENPGHGPDVILALASRKNVLILQNWDSSTDSDLWMLETHAGARPKIVVKAPGYQGDPSISPDGKWVAYASNESGRFEVYLQNILDPNQKRVVSTQGGLAPAWNEDGSEVYYLSPHFDLTAVEVDLERGIVVGTPRRLFHAPPGVSDLFGTIELSPELVSCRGGRFLFNVTIDAAASQKITVVLNWPVRVRSD
jgi:dipeptidyl aminopeptidase/acylaminoacyl peptidase